MSVLRLVAHRPWAVCLALVTLVAVVTVGSSAVANSGSTYDGRQLSVSETIEILYRAGFRTEAQLMTATSIAIAESSLYSRARRWHPEYGYRPAGTPLGAKGPSTVRDGDRQLHSDRGIFQISSRSWPDHADAATDDPAQAARLTLRISEEGTDFSPWDTYNSGNARLHWDASYDGWPAVRPLVRQFLQGKPDAFAGELAGVKHVVASEETLFRIAGLYYGAGHLWTRIADHNGITDPRSVRRGQVVFIP
jgi:hypothetical protein